MSKPFASVVACKSSTAVEVLEKGETRIARTFRANLRTNRFEAWLPLSLGIENRKGTANSGKLVVCCKKVVNGLVGNMDDSDLENFLKAGKIAAKVKEFAAQQAVPGKKLLEIAEAVEEKILREGGGIAFPVNLSQNECAAHHTPGAVDETVLAESDVLKVDIGVHVGGMIADFAFSVAPQEHSRLVLASEKALACALEKMSAGTSVREVGAAIEETIRAAGFKPVENLCGHSLGKNRIHAGLEIPNTGRGNYVLKGGDVFAVEPFASTGRGVVREGEECEIFSLAVLGRKVRMPHSREVLEFVEKNYSTLPFARRWLVRAGFAGPKINFALADLKKQGLVHGYPVLKDASGSLVSQAETSVVVREGKCIDLLSQ